MSAASSSSRAARRWLAGATGSAKAQVAVLTLLRSAVSVTAVGFALALSAAIDAATAGERAGFVGALLALTALVVAQVALQAVARWLTELCRSRVENALKHRAYATILTRRYAALGSFHTGELQNRMTNDVVVVADGMASIVPNVVAMLVKIVGAAGVLVALDWRFGLVFVAGGAVVLAVTYGFRRVMKRLHKRVQEADGDVRSFLQETVGSLLVLRSFGGEGRAAGQADARMAHHQDERMLRNRFSNLCNIGLAVVMNGGYLFGLAWCGLGIMEGTISYGTLAAVLQLVNQIQAPFANVTGYLPKYYAMMASAERLMELEELPEEDRADTLSAAERDEAYRALERIEFRDVTFAYPRARAEGDDAPPENPLVMAHRSLSLRKGDFVAVVGRSGIGKSTLLKLLLAVYEPQEGQVVLAFRDGSERAASAATRPLFAYVPQGNLLLSGTVREAVAFAQDGQPDQARVEEACRIACADFVWDLPQAFDTPIGEQGAGISEGQAQRIAIARALYSSAPVLLLDESTSALDEQTEERLLRNLRELTDRTVLVVTHRPAALAVCDQVVHMEPPEGEAD